MDDHLAQVVGDRVRFYREAAHKTKTVVAGLAGITPDYLYQIEGGKKIPTLLVLAQLAEVLRVDLGRLVSHLPAPSRLRKANGAGAALSQALTGPSPQPTSPPPTLAELRADVAKAWHTWQTSPQRYTLLTAQLPTLITSAEAVLRHADDSRAAHQYAADLYCLVRTVTKRIGREDLSLLVADRALRTAEAADDPIRLAAAHWNMTQVLLSGNDPQGAEDVAVGARDSLRKLATDGDPDAIALSGALLLLAAIAAVRNGNAWTARDRLREAAPLAKHVGERNTCWTAFGPTNVAMYAVSVEVETGEAVEGLRLAERIEHDRSPSIERRVAFLLDQAKGYGQRRDYASALLCLQTAEQDAPEDVENRPAAHALLRTVVERGRRSVSLEASRLATRVSLPL
ncbi:helix-turn-helix domain-containing protein [Amycolatopsis magusensis]|uniref:helix-turn-helix domain-containing protein n=1 Tax=Amycolatopsis magusensis TaxID=882444 RepID=UPI00379F93CC